MMSEVETQLEIARALLAGADTPPELWEANDAANRAIALAPHGAEGWLLKCQIQSALEDDTAALACAEMAVRRAPMSSEGHYWRATVLADLGQLDDALRALDRAFQVLAAADDWLREELHFEKGRILGEAGRTDEAREAVLAGLAQCPGSALLRAGLEPLERTRVRGLLKVLPGGAT